jgi:hypothetical protein
MAKGSYGCNPGCVIAHQRAGSGFNLPKLA